MRTIIYWLALAATVLPTAIQARGPEHRFARDGATYVYTVQPGAGGRQVIEGHRLPGGSAFRLVVSGDRVDGVSGGQPVAFRTTRPAPLTLAAR